MSCGPVTITNTTMVLAPPDPVTDFVRLKIYKGNDLLLVIDVPPNSVHDVTMHFIGQGWIVKGRSHANGEFSVEEDTEEFDGCDPGDFAFTPTNAAIPGPDLELAFET